MLRGYVRGPHVHATTRVSSLTFDYVGVVRDSGAMQDIRAYLDELATANIDKMTHEQKVLARRCIRVSMQQG